MSNLAVPGDGPSGGNKPRSNHLLAQLPEEEFGRLLPDLRTIQLPAKRILLQQGERLRSVYFPNGGLISMASVLPDGGMVEVATVGDEGLVGVEAFFAEDSLSSCETVVQISGGTAEELSVHRFRGELVLGGALYRVVAHYAHLLHVQMVRLTACNALHHVHERCARWLLMADDHMHGRSFHLSHDTLAVMLGVRRPTVSVVAGIFQETGLIRYMHGEVTILDRKGLEATACDCYAAIRTLTERRKSLRTVS